MINHSLHLVREYGIPDIEEVALVTLDSLGPLIREILLHLRLVKDLGIQILDSDFIPVRWVNEINLLHCEEVLLSTEYRLQVILCNLSIWR